MTRGAQLVGVAILALVAVRCAFIGQGRRTPAQQPVATSPTAVIDTDTAVRPVDGMMMIHIPAGEFLMGDNASPHSDEGPEHIIGLRGYWIDQTEVTNAQYRRCVDAGFCQETRSWRDGNLNGDDQPVLVRWDDAQEYCVWVDGRLPTEPEWEKAARGADGRSYPWGREFDPSRANLQGEEDGYEYTAPVGSFPAGASPYGLLDMSGNAAEWVADWYDPDYYSYSPAQNPPGPASGEEKQARGDGSEGDADGARCTARAQARGCMGFRCVAPLPPSE